MEHDRIWEYFQTERVDTFGRARGRYAAMATLARSSLGREGGRVLNIGVGSGDLERILLERGWRVASLDPSAKALASLADTSIDARVGYAQDMPFDAGSFDVVVASEVLEHIEPTTRSRALEQIARVLLPRGWLIGSVPYREVLSDHEVICPGCGKVFHRWGHVSSFDIPALRAELARDFCVTSCRRRSFVDWQAARTPIRFAKTVAQSLLGRLGEPIASPSIEFAARKA
jgi:SAM-dependent methyltransferase